MKTIFMSIALGAMSFIGGTSFAAGVDPATVDFPWMNNATRDARYKFSDNSNKVHVLEAWTISCTYCAQNAAKVKALATEYAGDARVQFLDLGLDTSDSAYAQWNQRHRPAYPVVKDVGRVVWAALQQEDGVPQTFVLDCTGHLVDYTIGLWGQAETQTIRNAIARAKETTCD